MKGVCFEILEGLAGSYAEFALLLVHENAFDMIPATLLSMRSLNFSRSDSDLSGRLRMPLRKTKAEMR